jgi:hypothetical protein
MVPCIATDSYGKILKGKILTVCMIYNTISENTDTSARKIMIMEFMMDLLLLYIHHDKSKPSYVFGFQ